MAKEYPVVLRYTKVEVNDLFKAAYAEDLSKGGRYDLHGSTINIWPDAQGREGKRQKPHPIGTFHFQMRNASGIWKISTRHYGLAHMLYELRELELKALGQVKHGRASASWQSQPRVRSEPETDLPLPRLGNTALRPS